MRIQENRRHLVILYMVGFLCGIFYANFVAKNYITVTGIFHEYFLNQYIQAEIIEEEYLWYLFRFRAAPFAGLILAGCTDLKKPAAVLCLLWTGFSAGVLAVAAVLRMGARGMLLCLAGVFPQIFFYIMGYAVILWYFYRYPQAEWNRGKTAFVAVMMAAGLLVEAYINPAVVRGVMKIVM